jgi:ferredoxin-nitrite reductase
MRFVRPFRKTGELNQVEGWKLARHPLEVYAAVVDRYASTGLDAIDGVPGEWERLKWVGLYPQVQGGDAFMLRIKVPGGRLAADQARVIGEVADVFARGPEPSGEFGDGFVDITTRQDVQLHWISIRDVPEIWRRLEAVGVTTVQACGDSARNVLCCPVSGIDRDEVVEAYPVAWAISGFFTGNRAFANLPRKWKLSVTGCREDCAQAEINDVGLWPARRADGTVGFNLLVGGGLSDGPRMASDIDVFVRPDQAVDLTRAIAQVFGELGNRENRGLSRMRYLVQELGPEGFRAALAERASFPLDPAGECLVRRYRGDHVGVHAQKQAGLVYAGLNVTVGRIAGKDLAALAGLARRYGDGELRLTTDQNLILAGVPEDRLDALLDEPLLGPYSPFPGPFERGAVACTGSEFCRFAIVETKARAARWTQELDRRLGRAPPTNASAGDHPGEPHRDGPRGRRHIPVNGQQPDEIVRIHLSGCSASCAQPQIADIGLRGETAHLADGTLVEAVDVGLGGSLGSDAAFIDFVEGAKPCDEMPDALVRLVETYRAERRDRERFHEWARRTPNDRLRNLVRAGPEGDV